MRKIRTLGIAATVAILAAMPVQGQGASPTAEPLIQSMRDGAGYIRAIFTGAAEDMSVEDYAFRPTPEVRSFGELLGHVADSNFFFCSAALGERPPLSGIEKTRTTREGIRQALTESLDYCDRAFRDADYGAEATIEFGGEKRAPGTVLNFRNYHSLLHYGNVITYMRLRGKVPPSTQMAEGG